MQGTTTPCINMFEDLQMCINTQ